MDKDINVARNHILAAQIRVNQDILKPEEENQVPHLHRCFLKSGYCIKWVRLLNCMWMH